MRQRPKPEGIDRSGCNPASNRNSVRLTADSVIERIGIEEFKLLRSAGSGPLAPAPLFRSVVHWTLSLPMGRLSV